MALKFRFLFLIVLLVFDCLLMAQAHRTSRRTRRSSSRRSKKSCLVSGWSSWSACKPYCSPTGGKQQRSRYISFQGDHCPHLKEERECKQPKCDRHYGYCDKYSGNCKCEGGYEETRIENPPLKWPGDFTFSTSQNHSPNQVCISICDSKPYSKHQKPIPIYLCYPNRNVETTIQTSSKIIKDMRCNHLFDKDDHGTCKDHRYLCTDKHIPFEFQFDVESKIIDQKNCIGFQNTLLRDTSIWKDNALCSRPVAIPGNLNKETLTWPNDFKFSTQKHHSDYTCQSVCISKPNSESNKLTPIFFCHQNKNINPRMKVSYKRESDMDCIDVGDYNDYGDCYYKTYICIEKNSPFQFKYYTDDRDPHFQKVDKKNCIGFQNTSLNYTTVWKDNFLCSKPGVLMGGEIHVCKEINECSSNPCRNGAKCTDLLNDYKCSCLPGWSRKNCDVNIDECAPQPCKNGANCSDLINGYSCSCLPGWNGKDCDNNINECASKPCKNGATCSDLINGYSCSCLPGWSEKDCDININECVYNKCKQNSTCTDLVNGYKCECIQGWEGRYCEKITNRCQYHKCLNDAKCEEQVNSYRCLCQRGWIGKFCENRINHCDPYPCSPFSVCLNNGTSFYCICDAGFTGRLCHKNIDDCKNVNCNNGNCIDGVNNFHCVCNPGYTGKFCDVSINDCHTQPCVNGGFCKDVGGDFKCLCPAGYEGRRCEKACPSNKYGFKCVKTCNCLNSKPCDNVTGKCLNNI